MLWITDKNFPMHPWFNSLKRIRSSETNFSEILIKLRQFPQKMRLEISSAKLWLFHLGFNVLIVNNDHWFTYSIFFWQSQMPCSSSTKNSLSYPTAESISWSIPSSREQRCTERCQLTVRSLDLLHKSHNAPVPYPTMHRFVAEMCTCVHISVTKWCIVRYVLCIVGFEIWASLGLKSPTSQLFLWQFVQAYIKKLHILGPLWGEFPGDQEIPSQRTSNGESVSMAWRHHGKCRQTESMKASKFVNCPQWR